MTSGYLQDFRPPPGLRNQVYRYNDKTGAVTVVADAFTLPNGKAEDVLTIFFHVLIHCGRLGIAFSPDAKYAYIADTGANKGFWGWNQSHPASM